MQVQANSRGEPTTPLDHLAHFSAKKGGRAKSKEPEGHFQGNKFRQTGAGGQRLGRPAAWVIQADRSDSMSEHPPPPPNRRRHEFAFRRWDEFSGRPPSFPRRPRVPPSPLASVFGPLPTAYLSRGVFQDLFFGRRWKGGRDTPGDVRRGRGHGGELRVGATVG